MRVLLYLIIGLSLTHLLVANDPPATPTINEPEVDGQILNPFDVHMETEPFADPDPGDTHFCSDFEIRVLATDELVWAGSCLMGLESVHAHFGDGAFTGSLAGATELLHETEYVLRIRHRDDSGEVGTDWSAWAERPFVTGPPTQVFPLEGDDVENGSNPQWLDSFDVEIDLPEGSPAPSLSLESESGLLLAISGLAGPVNLIDNPGILPDHAALRLRISAGSLAGGLTLPQSSLTFVDHEGDTHTVHLPSLQVGAGTDTVLWIAASGATYYGGPLQMTPDFSNLAQGIPVPWVVQQPGYKVEIVATGLQLPVNIAFVPNPGPDPEDPLYYVTELYGTIKVIANDGTISDYASDLLDYTPSGAFPGSGEQGLTGIAVEPITGDVYAAMLYDGGGPHYPKVVRFTSLDGGLTAATETIVLDMVGESQGQSHQISNLSFGPDGLLYVHMGDGFDAFTAQNLDSFRGKILRMNLDGSAPIDNPFYDASNGINSRDYVYAYGVRNPFGGAWRASDGFHYEVENGPSTDRFAKVNPGQNFQWNGSDASMSQSAILTWAPAVGPTNIAFVQPTTFGGSLFPASSYDHAFIADSGPTWATGPQSRGKRIREYVLDASGNLVDGPLPFVEYVGTGKATAVGLAAGPDGLYFTDLYKDLDYNSPTDVGANVLRVKFIGAADFTADVTDGLAPLAVNFFDTSTVPGPTGWEWDFGDGNSSTQQNPSHTYAQDGIYTVRLAVTGANGVAVEQKAAFVRVGEFPSVALIGSQLPPTNGDESVAEVLEQLGFEVVHLDDEPGNRPTASEITADHDLVLISSTGFSGNIADEFRNEPIPLVSWEHALFRIDREPLAGDSAILLNQSAIDLVDNSHPITQGLSLGFVPVFDQPSTLSVLRAPLATQASVLATWSGSSDDVALMAADAGTVLLGGHIAPEKRAFIFLEDSGLLDAAPYARSLLERAVLWAIDVEQTFTRGDCNDDGAVDIADPVRVLGFLFAGETGLSCMDACDTNDDGAVDVADPIFQLTALFDLGTPIPAPTACGTDPTLDGLNCAGSICP